MIVSMSVMQVIGAICSFRVLASMYIRFWDQNFECQQHEEQGKPRTLKAALAHGPWLKTLMKGGHCGSSPTTSISSWTKTDFHCFVYTSLFSSRPGVGQPQTEVAVSLCSGGATRARRLSVCDVISGGAFHCTTQGALSGRLVGAALDLNNLKSGYFFNFCSTHLLISKTTTWTRKKDNISTVAVHI